MARISFTYFKRIFSQFPPEREGEQKSGQKKADFFVTAYVDGTCFARCPP